MTPQTSSTTAGSPSISVVVPVFNSQDTLPELVQRLVRVLRALGSPFEVILVNDGSQDQSWSTIVRLSEGTSEVVGIDLLRNFGQHNALLCGIRAARFDVIVTMDDDLQQPPEELPPLIGTLQEGWDVVYGQAKRRRHSFTRHTMSRVTKAALRSALGHEAAPLVSTYRVFWTQLRTAFEHYNDPMVSIDVLLGWATTRFTAVRVDHHARRSGRSSYNFWRLVRHTMNMVTGFSVLPLQAAAFVGFIAMLFGMLVLAFVIVRYLWAGTTTPGFPFLACIIVIFSGVQLFALGILGEYLGRMHMRSLDRPAYAVRQRVEGGRP